MEWANSPVRRDQLTMLPTCLDDDIPADHDVRLLDEVLRRVDWKEWELAYKLTTGRPPIHPRVLASILLYGLQRRIRSSRGLEAALQERFDFRWLAEGRSIDHTTLSEFRRKHSQPLRKLFVDLVRVAIDLDWTALETLAFDGTRIAASNRRSGTRTPEELRQLQRELAARYTELEAECEAADQADDRRFGPQGSGRLSRELADVERRRKRIEDALQRLGQAQQEGVKPPKRIPLTDPESRVMPNKDGGFAPNYTPLATVDVTTGLVIGEDVIAGTDEDKHLIAAVEQARQDFGAEVGKTVLADGMMSTGENLEQCAQRDIDLYSPTKLDRSANDPTLREDPRQPVPPEAFDRLPTDGKGRLDKRAFTYDAKSDCYWCPQGKPLTFKAKTSERRGATRRIRSRYESNARDCAGCPLRERCHFANSQRRSISREQHEARREAQAAKMAKPEAQQRYAQRRHPGERPFAMIKEGFGARRFLLRGLNRVKQEWAWLTIAFNLTVMMRRLRGSPGPPATPAVVAS